MEKASFRFVQKSECSRLLEADPDLKMKADAIVAKAREAAAEDLRAIMLSERITAADLAVTVF